MANELDQSVKNPFSSLNTAQLESEARRLENVRLAQPFNELVVRLLKQMTEASGWNGIVRSDLENSRWSLYIPRDEKHWFNHAYKLDIHLVKKDSDGELLFDMTMKSEFADGSGSHVKFPQNDDSKKTNDWLSVPATEEGLVQALTKGVSFKK